MNMNLVEQPVGLLVREKQSRAGVFEQFGIDYCCHGDMSLAAACRRAGVALDDVCEQLDTVDSSASTQDARDWSCESLSKLIDHILRRHHSYLREWLPRLSSMIDRVVDAHANRHEKLLSVREVFAGLKGELLSHMMKEERVLFPMIIELEQAAETGHAAPEFHCGSVGNPIGVMEEEHESAGRALWLLRHLTHDYQPPDDACETYRAMLAGLKDLEADLHLHIHLENNILFPRAAGLQSTASPVLRFS